MTTVTVYSKPSCVQCSATQRALDKLGIVYTSIDLEVDAEAFAKVRAMGFQQAPVVVAGEVSWAGYRPDQLAALGAELRA